jgi:hypothetical protein
MDKETADINGAILQSSVDRDREVYETTLRNFEVARENLPDTQLSSEAAAVRFYEGCAYSLARHGTIEEKRQRTIRASDCFKEASRLGEIVDVRNKRERASGFVYDRFLVVALHARYNLIVLEHRKVVGGPDRATTANLSSVETQYRDLQRAIEDLLGPESPLPETLAEQMTGQLVGIRIALSCAILTCELASAVAVAPVLRPEEMRARINAIVTHAQSIREQLHRELRGSSDVENVRDQETLRFFISTALSNIERQSLTMIA